MWSRRRVIGGSLTPEILTKGSRANDEVVPKYAPRRNACIGLQAANSMNFDFVENVLGRFAADKDVYHEP